MWFLQLSFFLCVYTPKFTSLTAFVESHRFDVFCFHFSILGMMKLPSFAQSSLSNVLLSFLKSVYFLFFLFLLISNSILCQEWDLGFALCPSMWLISEKVPLASEKKLYSSAFGLNALCVYVRSIWFMISLTSVLHITCYSWEWGVEVTILPRVVVSLCFLTFWSWVYYVCCVLKCTIPLADFFL